MDSKRLRQCQRNFRLSDHEFAKVLGVGVPVLVDMRNGKEEIYPYIANHVQTLYYLWATLRTAFHDHLETFDIVNNTVKGGQKKVINKQEGIDALFRGIARSTSDNGGV